MKPLCHPISRFYLQKTCRKHCDTIEFYISDICQDLRAYISRIWEFETITEITIFTISSTFSLLTTYDGIYGGVPQRYVCFALPLIIWHRWYFMISLPFDAWFSISVHGIKASLRYHFRFSCAGSHHFLHGGGLFWWPEFFGVVKGEDQFFLCLLLNRDWPLGLLLHLQTLG